MKIIHSYNPKIKVLFFELFRQYSKFDSRTKTQREINQISARTRTFLQTQDLSFLS